MREFFPSQTKAQKQLSTSKKNRSVALHLHVVLRTNYIRYRYSSFLETWIIAFCWQCIQFIANCWWCEINQNFNNEKLLLIFLTTNLSICAALLLKNFTGRSCAHYFCRLDQSWRERIKSWSTFTCHFATCLTQTASWSVQPFCRAPCRMPIVTYDYKYSY